MLLRRRPCSNRSISPPRRAHSSKPVARCCSGRMGQIDGWTPYRFVDSAPHTVRAVRIKGSCLLASRYADVDSLHQRDCSKCDCSVRLERRHSVKRIPPPCGATLKSAQCRYHLYFAALSHLPVPTYAFASHCSRLLDYLQIR